MSSSYHTHSHIPHTPRLRPIRRSSGRAHAALMAKTAACSIVRSHLGRPLRPPAHPPRRFYKLIQTLSSKSEPYGIAPTPEITTRRLLKPTPKHLTLVLIFAKKLLTLVLFFPKKHLTLVLIFPKFAL